MNWVLVEHFGALKWNKVDAKWSTEVETEAEPSGDEVEHFGALKRDEVDHSGALKQNPVGTGGK